MHMLTQIQFEKTPEQALFPPSYNIFAKLKQT